MEAAAEHGVGDRSVVGLPEELGEAPEEYEEAEGDEYLRKHGRVDDSFDKQVVGGGPYDEKGEGHRGQ